MHYIDVYIVYCTIVTVSVESNTIPDSNYSSITLVHTKVVYEKGIQLLIG